MSTKVTKAAKVGKIMDFFISLSSEKKVDFKEEFYGERFDKLYDASDEFLDELSKKINERCQKK